MQAFLQVSPETLGQSFRHRRVLDGPAVEENELVPPAFPRVLRGQYEAAHAHPRRQSFRHRHQLAAQLVADELAHAIHRVGRGGEVEDDFVIPAETEAHPRRGERVQPDLLLHVRGLGAFCSHEFPPRGHVEKQAPRLDHRPGRTARVAHIAHFPAIHDDFRPGNILRAPREHAELRHAGDARHRLAAEA